MPDEKDKKIVKLESENLSLRMINKNYQGLRSKIEILNKIKQTMNTREEKMNNLYYYEDGMIESLLWVLNLPSNTSIEQIKHKIKNI